MTVEICSCEGLNPQCEKCFGSGYINSGTSKKPAVNPQENAKAPKKAKPLRQSSLPESLDSLSRKELENEAIKIIDVLDEKSKKQMQILNSIPFSSTTFRIDFKDKFRNLQTLERDKQFLRSDLDTLIVEMTTKKYTNHYKFKHYLSDKEIDMSSNRQLKGLIRAYKKLKNDAGSK